MSGKRFPWGDTISQSQANYNSSAGYAYDLGPVGYNPTYYNGATPYTSPVGSFAANGYGLYDMAGNVYEWTADCWHESYADAPKDGKAWEEAGRGDCARRVIRGGSWDNIPDDLRSASRLRYSTDDRNTNIGFRLAQDL